MRAVTAWRIGLCMCASAASCGKKSEEAPARTVAPAAPAETPAARELPVAIAPVVRPMEPLRPVLPSESPEARVEPTPPVEPPPPVEPAPVEPAAVGFATGTGAAAVPEVPGPSPEPPAPEAVAPAGTAVPASGGAGTELGIASIELCRAIDNRHCVEPAASFAPRELVWALLRVTNPERAETELRVSYVSVGTTPAPGEGLALRVPAQERYTTFSKAGKNAAGRYEVVVSALDGRELGRAPFEVR